MSKGTIALWKSFNAYEDIARDISDCKDARETRLRKDGRMGIAIPWRERTLLPSYLITFISWISSCGWARGDSEHDRGTSQSTVSCLHDDVGGKVWRAVTTLSLSFGPQNLYDRLSCRPDIEERVSSFFASLASYRAAPTSRETDGRRVPSATRWPISDFVSLRASLCSFLTRLFSSLPAYRCVVTSPQAFSLERA